MINEVSFRKTVYRRGFELWWLNSGVATLPSNLNTLEDLYNDSQLLHTDIRTIPVPVMTTNR